MGIVGQKAVFKRSETGDFVFSHTKFILIYPDANFCVKTTKQYLEQVISLTGSEENIQTFLIPLCDLWPELPPGLTLAPPLQPSRCDIKRVDLMHWENDASVEKPGQRLLREAEILERLKGVQHRNLGTYHGCIMRNERLFGLCFPRYDMTLADMDREILRANQSIYESIEEGIEFLHSMALVHGNLNESNVGMIGNTPVIINFDHCGRLGDLSERVDHDGLRRIYRFIWHEPPSDSEQ